MSLACLTCAKTTVDLVGQLVDLANDNKEDKDLQILQLVKEHFNNPQVKAQDWAYLQQAYGAAVDRITRRLQGSNEMPRVNSEARIIITGVDPQQ